MPLEPDKVVRLRNRGKFVFPRQAKVAYHPVG